MNEIYNLGILGADGIHTPDKQQVGYRAANAFAEKFYNPRQILSSPVLVKAEKDGENLMLTYTNGKLKLTEKLCGFEVSDKGINFVYARPQLVGKTYVKLTSTLKNTKYVRYGYAYDCFEVFGGTAKPYKIENLVCLYNEQGYPAD